MAALSYIAGLYLPWWSIAVIVFIISVIIPQKPLTAFVCSFFSLFMLWTGLSYWVSYNNGNILAQKVSLLLFNIGNPFVIIITTGLIGGLVAGFAGLSGSYLRYKRRLSHEY